ncbi:hypothetical protein EC988_002293 [Linderina pennispora]|nr:hypothetical protein EC988_002293 [Linderina pennispora]
MQFDYEAMEEKRQEQTELWKGKLIGKKFIEDESLVSSIGENEFTANQLPQSRRILKGENVAMTMDFRPDRINVRLDKDGICRDVAITSQPLDGDDNYDDDGGITIVEERQRVVPPKKQLPLKQKNANLDQLTNAITIKGKRGKSQPEPGPEPKPESASAPSINQAISKALLNAGETPLGGDFLTSLLMSAVKDSHGDMPVISMGF